MTEKRRLRPSEYNAWRTMRQRCNNPNNYNYWRYGGRGIAVCKRWNESYANFINDMGAKPSPSHSLERVNNDLGYSPENCIWATLSQQASNTRQNNYITVGGVKDTITGWARKLNCMPSALRGRLKRGWSAEKTVTTPPNENYPGFTREKRKAHALRCMTGVR